MVLITGGLVDRGRHHSWTAPHVLEPGVLGRRTQSHRGFLGLPVLRLFGGFCRPVTALGLDIKLSTMGRSRLEVDAGNR